MTNSDQDAIDAVDTLNDLIGDLIAGFPTCHPFVQLIVRHILQMVGILRHETSP